MNTEKLKACPFCGSGDVILTKNKRGYSVHCYGCNIDAGFWNPNRDHTIWQWNRRPDIEKSQSACEHIFIGCALTGKNCKTRGETKCESCEEKPETNPPLSNGTNCPYCARIINTKVNGLWYCRECRTAFAKTF